jgi:hypothetical protein
VLSGPVARAGGAEPAAARPAPAQAEALAPSQILCGEQYKTDPRSKLSSLAQCTDAANAFYREEWQPQVQALLTGKPAALEPLRAATTFELPDGSLIPGNTLGTYFRSVFGDKVAGISEVTSEFSFKPIDRDTILVYGTPKFKVKAQDGTSYVVPSAQLSVYRRCRKDAAPRGWEELGELWSYQAELRGPKPPATAAPPAPPKPAR